MRSVQKTKVRIFSVWNEQLAVKRALFYRHREFVGKVSENLRNIIQSPVCENKNTTFPDKFHKFLENYGEFLVNFRQTVGDPYPSIFSLHFPQACLSKHAKI